MINLELPYMHSLKLNKISLPIPEKHTVSLAPMVTILWPLEKFGSKKSEMSKIAGRRESRESRESRIWCEFSGAHKIGSPGARDLFFF